MVGKPYFEVDHTAIISAARKRKKGGPGDAIEEAISIDGWTD